MAAKYTEGQVAQLLFSQTESHKTEKKKKKLKKLENIFNVNDTDRADKFPSQTVKRFAGTSSLKLVSGRSPHKDDRPSPHLDSSLIEGYCPPPNVVHESLQKGSVEKKSRSKKRKLALEEAESGLKRRKKGPRDTSDDYRTVFVGSLSNQVTAKTLKQMFNKYGKIRSVRLRGAISENEKLPKRAIVITKKFHPNMNTLYGYVVFEERESALKATELNTTEMDGQILRVDIADQAEKHQHKKCIFVGNLPYNVQETMIRRHFTDCGQVVDIHLIRDKATGKGKGFAYVRFTESSAVSLALKLDESTLGGRQIRVRRSNEEASNKRKLGLEQNKRSQTGRTREHKNVDSRKNAGERLKKAKKNHLDPSKKDFKQRSTEHNFKKPKTFKHNKKMNSKKTFSKKKR